MNNNLFIKSIVFDWDKVEEDSYLREIEAFQDLDKLDFNVPVTFFCW